MKVKKQTEIWTTKDGRKVRICDMDDDHLRNTIRMLRRNAIKKQQSLIGDAYMFAGGLQGEMALDAIDWEIDCMERAHWTEFTHPIFKFLMLDYKRRFGVIFDGSA